MTTLDIVILGVALFLFVIGIFKGLLKRIFSVASAVIVVTCGSMLAPLLQSWEWLANLIDDAELLSTICFVGSYVILALVCFFASKILTKIITKKKSVGALNRILGGVLSLAEVYVFVAMIMVLVVGTDSVPALFVKLNAKYSDSISDSWIYQNIFAGDKNFLGNWMMKPVIQLLRDTLERLTPVVMPD